jgi:hypothetical protein
MAQFYTLEEAARVLGMGPEDLKQKAQQREVRAFMDGGSWQFRVADIDELARRRGLGSDPELLIPDSNLELADGSGSGEIDLSEFQLGTGKSDLSARTTDLAGGMPVSDDDQDVQFDDLSLPPGPLTSSSSTIIGMNQKKSASDSDVRLMPDKPLKGRADSQVRLRVDEPLSPPSSRSSTTRIARSTTSAPSVPIRVRPRSAGSAPRPRWPPLPIPSRAATSS